MKFPAVTLNVTAAAFAGTVMEGGRVRACELALMLTETPPAGAMEARVAVQLVVELGERLGTAQVREERGIGATRETEACAVEVFRAAVRVAV